VANRTKIVISSNGSGGMVQERVSLSDAENVARDIEEAKWEAEKPDRDWVDLRRERNDKLKRSDWTQMLDVPSEGKETWANYRQSLRDLPDNTPDPSNPTWPTMPE